MSWTLKKPRMTLLEKGTVRDFHGNRCSTENVKYVRRHGYSHRDPICIEDKGGTTPA